MTLLTTAARQIRGAIVVTLLACLAPSLQAQSRAEVLRLVNRTVPGTVVSVADGDTVRVRVEGMAGTVRVRLEGIDAPETREPFSTQARHATRVLMFDKKVQVKGRDVDTYDRLVARIIVNGKDASVELLETGLACHFTRFENDPVLARAQLDARTAGRGFWAAGAPKPRCVDFTRRSAPQPRK